MPTKNQMTSSELSCLNELALSIVLLTCLFRALSDLLACLQRWAVWCVNSLLEA
jgi:hypothetical protein